MRELAIRAIAPAPMFKTFYSCLQTRSGDKNRFRVFLENWKRVGSTKPLLPVDKSWQKPSLYFFFARGIAYHFLLPTPPMIACPKTEAMLYMCYYFLIEKRKGSHFLSLSEMLLAYNPIHSSTSPAWTLSVFELTTFSLEEKKHGSWVSVPDMVQTILWPQA